jgi:hypothetical protein
MRTAVSADWLARLYEESPALAASKDRFINLVTIVLDSDVKPLVQRVAFRTSQQPMVVLGIDDLMMVDYVLQNVSRLASRETDHFLQ